jgi:hypothetical protein
MQRKGNGPVRLKERGRAFDGKMRGRDLKGRMRNRRSVIGRFVKEKYSHYLIDESFANLGSCGKS